VLLALFPPEMFMRLSCYCWNWKVLGCPPFS